MISSKHYLLYAIGLLLLLLFGGLIFVNFLLYNYAKQYYLELNQTRLDPLGLSNYPILKTATKADRVRVVFLGDSRAAGWISPKVDKYEFVNRGISSQTSVQTLQRFSAHMRHLKPDIVVIQIGINDLKTIALFPDRKQEIVANCRSNIQQIIEESRNLGAVAIVTTIFPAGEIPLERKPFWSDEIDQTVKSVNADLVTLATNKVLLFDTYSLLADRQGLMLPQYRSDELHLNDLGYDLLNQQLIKIIDKIDLKNL